MPSCSIKECGARKNNNHPTLTLHRLPVNEILKRKWINIIGLENINPRHKMWYVCSMHFHETSFNRTLGVTRLRDCAVPLSSLQASQILPKTMLDSQPTSSAMVQQESSTSSQKEKKKILTKKCDILQRKVRSLNEKVRRRDQKIARCSEIIKHLKEKKFINTEESHFGRMCRT
ncbi:unnamed protein product [Arctia plantaginis]|uniref:THAP-type domain-containing protein n=1 Tax=Arctia plantaginis TaxID=874455 RepID=A0A8S0ZEK3_ARCPL|nr:unnamed protein product [Arctia plantaginis]